MATRGRGPPGRRAAHASAGRFSRAGAAGRGKFKKAKLGSKARKAATLAKSQETADPPRSKESKSDGTETGRDAPDGFVHVDDFLAEEGAASTDNAAPAGDGKRPSKSKKPKDTTAPKRGKAGARELKNLVRDEDFTGGRWFECAPEWPESEDAPTLSEEDQEQAAQAMLQAREIYEKKFKEQTSRFQGFSSGTVTDQISALALSVQESPVHHLEELQKLVKFAEKKAARVKEKALEAVQDLLLNDLLPDRPLRPLRSRTVPAQAGRASLRQLLYAFFESELKGLTIKYLEQLRQASLEGVAHMRSKAVDLAAALLVQKPEGEKDLLTIVVNKLGDPERKVASKAVYQLKKLLTEHPAMKPIVTREVEQVLFRANVKRRAQYYAVNFLNQIELAASDVEVARQMISMYMSLFRKVTSDNSDSPELDVQESKLVAAILVGVNRAFPYSQAEADTLYDTAQFEILFQVSHAESYRSSTQALALLQQVADARASISDRFYRALYSKVSSAQVRSHKNPSAFLNIVYRAMKKDDKVPRVQAFAKRLLQVASCASPGFAVGALSIISKTMLESRRAVLHSFTALPEAESEIEQFADAVDSDDGELDAIAPSAVASEEILSPNVRPAVLYDPNKRDPLYCHAEKSSFWELALLCQHFHPTVQKYSRDLLLAGEEIPAKGNPLVEYSLLAFLDRFVYKKPKKNVRESLRAKRQRVPESSRPLANSAELRELASAGQVAEDDRFYLKFFETRKVPEARWREVADAEAESEDEEQNIDRAFEEAMRKQFNLQEDDFGDFAGDDDDGDDVDDDDDDDGDDGDDDGDDPESVFRAGDIDGEGASDASDADVDRSAVDEEEPEAETQLGDDRPAGGGGEKERGGKKRRHSALASVFAPAEEYTEAVEEIMGMEARDNADEAPGNADKPTKADRPARGDKAAKARRPAKADPVRKQKRRRSS